MSISAAEDGISKFVEMGFVPVLMKFVGSIVNPGTTNTSGVVECRAKPVNMDYAELFMIIPSVMITLFLSFFIKRRSACLQFCHGRPGVAIPMNAINLRHLRLAYLFAFGSVTPTILKIFSGSRPLEQIITFYPPWSSNLLKIVAVVMYGTIWYPLFATISAEMISGYILGFMVVAMHFTLLVYNEYACTLNMYSTTYAITIHILIVAPQYTFMTLMMGYFVYVIIRQLLGRSTPSEIAKLRENETIAVYVRNVFRLKKEYHGIKEMLKSSFVANTPGFIFPPRFICSLLIAGVVLYTFAVSSFGVLVYGMYVFKRRVEALSGPDERSSYEVFQSILSYNASNPKSMMNIMPDASALVVYLFDLALIIVSISTSVTVAITVAQFPLIVINYRRNVLLSYKGVYDYVIPPSRIRPPSAVSGFSRFVGYQAAYLIWGYVIIWIVLALILTLLTLFFFVPIVNGFGQFWIKKLLNYWPSLLTIIVFMIATSLITRFVFVDKSSGPIIAITNRSCYFVWAYYLTFYDVFIGLFSCLLRIIKSMVIGIFFIGRIDVPVISRNFENLDPGYSVYSQFIATEVAHNNPIMRCFLNILIEQGQAWSKNETSRSEVNKDPESPIMAFETISRASDNYSSDFRRHRQLVFRWQLLYTLHNNPSVAIFRTHRIERFQELMKKKREALRRKAQTNNEDEKLLNENTVIYGAVAQGEK